MRKVLALMTTFLAPLPGLAADFSAGSAAEEWGLLGEEKARFEAKVVDVLCELSGDCPAECGAGARQMGLLRKADGVLVLPVKNSQPLFTGAATDLAPFCGQDVEVDGLLVGDADQTKVKFFQVQLIRTAGAAEFARTERFTEVWAKANPDAPGEGDWYRRDPRIAARIATEGWFGLGLERDAAILKELFPQ